MLPLNLTFLGTGTSVGIPMIGCQCDTCTSIDPKDNRTRCSIYLESEDGKWLIDTGPDLRTQCLREKISEVDHVFITHAHVDHIAGFDELRRFTFEQEASMPIHAHAETLQALERMFTYAFDGENRYVGYLKPEPKPITDLSKPIIIGYTSIQYLPVEHGKVQTGGYLFSKNKTPILAYFPDCKSWPQETKDAVKGVHTLIVDGLRHTPHPTHQNIDEAIALSREMQATQTYLTHFNCDISHQAALDYCPEGVTPAYDGLKLTID